MIENDDGRSKHIDAVSDITASKRANLSLNGAAVVRMKKDHQRSGGFNNCQAVTEAVTGEAADIWIYG